METTTHPRKSHVHEGPTPPADTADRRYGPLEAGTEGRCACGTWVRFTGACWVPVAETPDDPED